MSKTKMTPEVFKQKAIDSLQSFDPGLIVRGAQLTVVGAYRALQNPNLFRSKHYKQAALAVAAGLIVRLILDLPIFTVKILLTFSGFFVDLKTAAWDDWIITGLRFLEKNVLQIPFFLMTLLIRMQRDDLDEMFMESLSWVDLTNLRKHPDSIRSPYHPTLTNYPRGSPQSRASASKSNDTSSSTVGTASKILSRQQGFIMRMLKKGLISLVVYYASMFPILGKLVLPAASAWSLHPAVGIGPAIGVFVAGLFVPRKKIVIALQAYHASRNLVRQLLEPYFNRIPFTPAQKKKWFRERQGLLLGFGLGFYLFLRIPLMGILIYGIAEASTAYLITKITDPPPLYSQQSADEYAASQAEWKGKDDFVTMPLREIGEMAKEAIGDVREGLREKEKGVRKRKS